MKNELPLFLACALIVPVALSSSGDSRPGLAKDLEAQTRASLASIKEVQADPISTGGVFVLNSVNTPVVGLVPMDSSGAAAPLSGSIVWSTSAGLNSAGFRGIMGVFPDNSGFVALYNSAGSAGTSISGNLGVRTFAGDVAEAFPASAAEPGSVMAIDPARPGALVLAREAYDRRVAGVVAGARDYNPGITLRGLAEIQGVTVTLSGTTYCLASDVNGPVRAGDLLTTSPVPGHAMRASDLDRARGAILGKAMEDLKGSRGHVLILASLQ